jgi:coenzyme PQQ precursor peptide PqqA
VRRADDCRVALTEGIAMAWTTPSFEEIDLSCEINCYSSAEL